MPKTPAKTAPFIATERVQIELQCRFNPIRGLTPAILSAYLDQFEQGYLRGLALLMRKIEERDDKLAALAPKRKKAPARLDWDVVIREGAPDAPATRQRDALLAALYNLEATSVVDEDERGGFALLVRQMMDAIGMRYSVHEIVWQPGAADLTAQFRHVPLWYFEHTTPRLRYLASDSALYGTDLEPGGWMVTRGDGLLIPSSVLYMFKSLPKKDLLNYCQRYAIPGLHGTTSASKGSDEWNALRDALKAFGQDWSLITNEGAKILPIDASAKGELPHPKLIEECNRAMSILWRGADLSTMSAGGDSSGASVQGEETDLLQDDDCAIIEDTLQRAFVPHLIRYATGDTEVHVELRLQRPQRLDSTKELAVDQFLISAGIPVGQAALLERYGRGAMDTDDTPAERPAAPISPMTNYPMTNDSSPAALVNSALSGNRRNTVAILAQRRNQRLQASARAALGKALAADLQPLRDRLAAALQAPDADLINSLRQASADIPALLSTGDQKVAQVFEDTITAALFNGYAEAKATREDTTP
jgi:phage gp29-like protein